MFKKWLIELVGIIILLTLFQTLSPEGKMSKIINILFSFVLLLFLIQPLKMLSEISSLSEIFKGL